MDVFASKMLSRATSIKETPPEVTERLKLLGCNLDNVEQIICETTKKFPKDLQDTWKGRRIKINPEGCIYVKYKSGRKWYIYPFNFDFK